MVGMPKEMSFNEEKLSLPQEIESLPDAEIVEGKEYISGERLSDVTFAITGSNSSWPKSPEASILFDTRDKRYKHYVESIERINRMGEKIDQGLKQMFPDSFTIIRDIQRAGTDGSSREREKMRSKLQSRIEKLLPEQKNKFASSRLGMMGPDSLINDTYPLFWGSKERGDDLYYLTSFLQGKALCEKNPLEEIRTVLNGKNILVLGDDVGTFSEVLTNLGAKAHGIERSGDSVEIAHTGIVAENFQPQTQVIKGDLLDLRDKNSGLYQIIKEKGPFDVIYSRSLFNSGSGFPESFEFLAEKENIDSGILWKKWFINTDTLLNEGGFHLHHRTDIYIPGTSIEEFAMQMHELLDHGDDTERREAKNNMSIIEHRFSGWPLADISTGGELAPRSGFLLRKGLIPFIQRKMAKE